MLAWWFLTKTRTGLVLCSVGERPDVTRAYGYNPVVQMCIRDSFQGIGQNIENGQWNTWFDRYAFPDASRFNDIAYADQAYTCLLYTSRCV